MTEYKRKNVWENLSQDQEKELESLSKDYMDFLDKGKTERLAAKEIINLAKKAGCSSCPYRQCPWSKKKRRSNKIWKNLPRNWLNNFNNNICYFGII